MDAKHTTVLIFGLALSFNAFANGIYDSESTNQWFAVDVSTVTTEQLRAVPWTYPTKGGEASVESKGISLDTDLDDPLVYTPSANDTNVVTITATIEATVNASQPDAEALGSPQAALVVVTNATEGGALKWCGLVGGSPASWVSFDSPNPTAGATYAVNIDIDNREGHKKIRYRLGDTVLGTGWYANPQMGKTSVESVAFAGTGNVGNFSGVNITENAATYNGVGFATAAEAFAAADNANWSSGKAVTLYADATYTGKKTGPIYVNANNHQFTIDGDVVSRQDGNTYTITLKTDCEAKIGNAYYVTFEEAVAAASASDTIVVNKAISKDLTVAKSYGLNPDGKLTCATLTVNADQTLTLAGALSVTTATVGGTVAGNGVLTVNGTLTGVNVAKLAFGSGATFAYADTKLAPTALTQSGALTITGLEDAEIGTEVITATGLDLSRITATVKEGTCLEIVGNTLTVVEEILATITTSSEAEGYDYTNGTVSVTANVKSGKTATAVLTVVGFDGTTVKTVAERQVTSGEALVWDVADAMSVALVQGGVYTYKVDVKVDNKVVATKSGEFTAAKWGADGAWFKADASSGSSVVDGGAWDGETPGIVNNKYAVSDSAFNVTATDGQGQFTRVDTKVSFESLLDGDPDAIEGDTIGGFVATTAGWKALTLVNEEKTWVTLENADAPAPAVNTEYAIRAELDFSQANVQCVRFFVAKEGGDFIPLFYNGFQWLETTKVQQTLQKVEFQGEGALESVMATVEDKALAEVGGTKYVTMTDALAAAKDNPSKSVRLLTNVTLAPTVAGTYRIDKNGHAFNLKLPAGWTSDWDESTGMLTVIDKQMPFVQELAASTICYGQVLSASELTGVMTNKNGTVVEGTFAWMESTVTPAVGDSDKTEYGVRFTPTDTTKYFEVEDIVSMVTVTAAVLTVTATDVTVVAGNDPEFGYELSGFVLGDTASVVSGTATYSCDYDKATSGAGTYDIAYASGLTAENYTFAAAATPGKLTVLQAEASYNGVNYASVSDALEAAKTAGEANPKVTVLVVDPEKPAEIPAGIEVDYDLNDEEVSAGSGTVELPYTGSGTVKVTTTDTSKDVIVVNPSGAQTHFTVTVETKPKLVTDIVVAGKALPSPDDNSDFKAWLDENIAAYKAANTSSGKILDELQAIVEANNISKLNNYLLFSKNVEDVTASDVVQIVKPGADTSLTGIKVDIPAVNPKSGMGYKVVYRVMKGETKVGDDITDKTQIEVPLTSGSGTYRVDAVIVPDNN